jgi:hypothetical protein
LSWQNSTTSVPQLQVDPDGHQPAGEGQASGAARGRVRQGGTKIVGLEKFLRQGESKSGKPSSRPSIYVGSSSSSFADCRGGGMVGPPEEAPIHQYSILGSG